MRFYANSNLKENHSAQETMFTKAWWTTTWSFFRTKYHFYNLLVEVRQYLHCHRYNINLIRNASYVIHRKGFFHFVHSRTNHLNKYKKAEQLLENISIEMFILLAFYRSPQVWPVAKLVRSAFFNTPLDNCPICFNVRSIQISCLLTRNNSIMMSIFCHGITEKNCRKVLIGI